MVLIHKNENTKTLNEKNSVHFELHELGGQRRWFHLTSAHDRWQSAFKDFGNHTKNRLKILLGLSYYCESSIVGWAKLEFMASFVFSDLSNPDSLRVKCRSTHTFWISNLAP